jgi:hypothetical protein
MELKDILGFVDIGDVKTVDEFKEKFNSKFAPKTDLEELDRKLKESTGKMTGAATTLIKRLGGLDNKDIDGKKWEEALEIAFQKKEATIKELEGKTGQTNDDAIKEYQKKLDKLSKERDDYKAAQEILQGTYEKDKGEWEGKLKNYKTGTLFESAKNKVYPKLKTDMSPAEKLGFDAALKEIIVDFDEQESPIVKDKEGKRIQNPNKAGSFLSLEEAIELKANELALIKKNTGGGNNLQGLFNTGQQNQNNNGGDNTPKNNGRTIHPSALSHAEKLKAQR